MSRNTHVLLVIGFLLVLLISHWVFAASVQYTYDSLNRLIRVEYDNGAFIEYEYDAAGNRTAKVVSAVAGCPGDLDHDGDVDGSDLAEYIEDTTVMSLSDFAGDFGKDNCY